MFKVFPKQLETLVEKSLGDDAKIIKPYRGMEIRASGLPFCQREYVLSNLANCDETFEDEGFFGNACMSMGTALHSVTQRFLGRSGMLFGHYQCPICRQVTRNVLGPVWCKMKSCRKEGKYKRDVFVGEEGVECVYEEYSIVHPCGLTGHPDGVLIIKDKAICSEAPIVALLEVKGSNFMSMRKMTDPVIKHWHHQANFYFHAFNEFLSDEVGFKLEKILFMYVDRGIPANKKFFLRDAVEESYVSTVKAIKKAKKKLALNVLPDRSCNDAKEGEEKRCKLVNLCFSSDAHIQQKVAERQHG